MKGVPVQSESITYAVKQKDILLNIEEFISYTSKTYSESTRVIPIVLGYERYSYRAKYRVHRY